MKQLINYYKALVTLLMLTFLQVAVFAQDSSGSSGGSSSGRSSSTTSTTVTTQETWYTQPWVWIVAGAILLLLIVALTRGNSSSSDTRSDKVTVTKSVRTDTDV